MLQNQLNERQMKGKGRSSGDEDIEEVERGMVVTALVAMIEIWMSDLWYVKFPS